MKNFYTIALILNIVFISIIIFLSRIIRDRGIQESIILDVVNANGVISTLLTRYARNYLLTGDPLYKKKYINILSIRDGDKPWDTFLKHPWFKGRTETLTVLYEKLNIDKADRKYLDLSDKLSMKVAWVEVEAMNKFDGRSDPDGSAKKEFDSQANKQYLDFPSKIEDKDDEAIKTRKQESISWYFHMIISIAHQKFLPLIKKV